MKTTKIIKTTLRDATGGYGLDGKVLELQDDTYYIGGKEVGAKHSAMFDRNILAPATSKEDCTRAMALSDSIDLHMGDAYSCCIPSASHLKSFIRAVRREWEWVG